MVGLTLKSTKTRFIRKMTMLHQITRGKRKRTKRWKNSLQLSRMVVNLQNWNWIKAKCKTSMSVILKILLIKPRVAEMLIIIHLSKIRIWTYYLQYSNSQWRNWKRKTIVWLKVTIIAKTHLQAYHSHQTRCIFQITTGKGLYPQ